MWFLSQAGVPAGLKVLRSDLYARAYVSYFPDIVNLFLWMLGMKRTIIFLGIIGIVFWGGIQSAQAGEYNFLPAGFTDGTPIDSVLRASGANITVFEGATAASDLARRGFKADTEVGLTFLGGKSWDNNLLVSKASGTWTPTVSMGTLVNSWTTGKIKEYTGNLGDLGIAYLTHFYDFNVPQGFLDNPLISIPEGQGYRFKFMLLNQDYTWFPTDNLKSKAITLTAGSILVGFEDGKDFDNNDMLFAIRNMNPSATPIPGAMWLLGTGIAGLVSVRRRMFTR